MSTLSTIGLIAQREIVAKVRTRSFLVGNLVALVITAALIVGIGAFSSDSDSVPRRTVALTPAAQDLAPWLEAASGPLYELEVTTAADPRAALVDDADLAVDAAPDGSWTIYSTEEPSTELEATIAGALQQRAIATVAGTPSPEALHEALDATATTYRLEVTDPPDPDRGERTVVAWLILILIFGQLIGFGTQLAMGVVEEKASRVVEVLLSTIRPLELMWGKVIGLGLLGMGQLVAYLAVAFGTSVAAGLLDDPIMVLGVGLLALAWTVLGYLLFGLVYAAAASTVSRQEEVQSAIGPLTTVVMVMYGAGFVASGDASSKLATVLGWIPPLSVVVMPVRSAMGEATWFQVVGALALNAVVALVLGKMAAGIYQRLILRTGTRVGWRQALRRSPS